MAFSYIISYSTEVDTTLIYNYKNILGRISWDGPLILRYLAILILFGISETSFIEMGYILLRIVTQLLVIFKLLLLV